jgi:Skp family chaperone for outer membrane proteins
MKAKTYDSIAKDYTDWVYANYNSEVSFCPLLETYSNLGETAGDFRARMAQTAREQRDAAVTELRTKLGKKVKDLEDDITKAMSKVEAQKSQANSAKLSTAIQIGTSLLGAFLGRKSSGLAGAASLIKGTTVNSASRAWKEGQDVDAAQAELSKLKMDYDALNKQLEDEVKALQDKYDPAALALETTKLTPLKKNITVSATGILWMPYERAGGSLKQAWG